MSLSRDKLHQQRRKFRSRLVSKVARKLEADQQEQRGILFWLGMFGMIGWSVVVPALLGTALGRWIDSRFSDGTTVSWTLTGLLGGVALGCANAWYWIKEEKDHE